MNFYSAFFFRGVLLTVVLTVAPWALANPSKSIPKVQFRQQFEVNLLKGFCEESKFANECFDMDAQTCRANVKSSLAKCFSQNPSLENIPQDKAADYGIKLGRCVGKDFEARNKSKLRKTNECLNPIEWLGK